MTVASDAVTRFSATARDDLYNTSTCANLGGYEHQAPVLPPVPPPTAHPTTPTVPSSPGNDPTPDVQACAPSGLSLILYGAAACDTPLFTSATAIADVACPDGHRYAGNAGTVSEGPTTFYARSRAADGRTSGCVEVARYTLDTTPPTITNFASTPTSPGTSLTPNISGSTEAGADVKVYFDDQCSDLAFAAIANQGGAFSDTVTVGADGETSLWATAADALGNNSACVAFGAYVHDPGAPAAPTAHPVTPTVPASPSNEGTHAVFACAEQALTLELHWTETCDAAAGESATAVADAACATGFAYSVADLTASEGDNLYWARTRSTYGRLSDCVSVATYQLDTTAPDVSDFATDPASPAKEREPAISGRTEAGADIVLATDADCVDVFLSETTSDGTFMTTLAVDADLETYIYAMATDALGNTNGCVAFGSYLHEDAPPLDPIAHPLIPTEPTSPSNDPAPTVNGCAEADSTVAVGLGDCDGELVTADIDDAECESAQAGSKRFTTSLTLDNDGTFTVFASATDAEGYASDCVELVGYTLDTSAPSIAPHDPATNPASPSDNLEPEVFACAERDAHIDFFLDAACADEIGESDAVGPGDGCPEDLASTAIATSLAGEGPFEFYAIASDALGNTSACTPVASYALPPLTGFRCDYTKDWVTPLESVATFAATVTAEGCHGDMIVGRSRELDPETFAPHDRLVVWEGEDPTDLPMPAGATGFTAIHARGQDLIIAEAFRGDVAIGPVAWVRAAGGWQVTNLTTLVGATRYTVDRSEPLVVYRQLVTGTPFVATLDGDTWSAHELPMPAGVTIDPDASLFEDTSFAYATAGGTILAPTIGAQNARGIAAWRRDGGGFTVEELAMPAGYNPLTFRLGRVSDDGRVVPGTAGSTPVVWREQGGWTRHALQVPNGYEGATTELAFDDGTVVGYARDDIGFGLYDRYPLMWAFVDGGTIAATLLEGREGELDKVYAAVAIGQDAFAWTLFDDLGAVYVGLWRRANEAWGVSELPADGATLAVYSEFEAGNGFIVYRTEDNFDPGDRLLWTFDAEAGPLGAIGTFTLEDSIGIATADVADCDLFVASDRVSARDHRERALLWDPREGIVEGAVLSPYELAPPAREVAFATVGVNEHETVVGTSWTWYRDHATPELASQGVATAWRPHDSGGTGHRLGAEGEFFEPVEVLPDGTIAGQVGAFFTPKPDSVQYGSLGDLAVAFRWQDDAYVRHALPGANGSEPYVSQIERHRLAPFESYDDGDRVMVPGWASRKRGALAGVTRTETFSGEDSWWLADPSQPSGYIWGEDLIAQNQRLRFVYVADGTRFVVKIDGGKVIAVLRRGDFGFEMDVLVDLDGSPLGQADTDEVVTALGHGVIGGRDPDTGEAIVWLPDGDGVYGSPSLLGGDGGVLAVAEVAFADDLPLVFTRAGGDVHVYAPDGGSYRAITIAPPAGYDRVELYAGLWPTAPEGIDGAALDRIDLWRARAGVHQGVIGGTAFASGVGTPVVIVPDVDDTWQSVPLPAVTNGARLEVTMVAPADDGVVIWGTEQVGGAPARLIAWRFPSGDLASPVATDVTPALATSYGYDSAMTSEPAGRTGAVAPGSSRFPRFGTPLDRATFFVPDGSGVQTIVSRALPPLQQRAGYSLVGATSKLVAVGTRLGDPTSTTPALPATLWGCTTGEPVCVEDVAACSSHGTCDQGDCTCSSGYTGETCGVCDIGYIGFPDCEPDPCFALGCSNDGGQCDVDGAGTATCECLPRFEGEDCSQCIAGYSGFSCDQCAPGFLDLDSDGDCEPDPCVGFDLCENGGTCTIEGVDPVCACDYPFGGPTCESCGFGLVGYPTCDTCPEGYVDLTSTPYLDCVPDPCTSDPCGGHGTCTASGNEAICQCDPGYIGTTCGFCDTGYSGFPHCETRSGCCTAQSCPGGTCAFVNGLGQCNCLSGTQGPRCGECKPGHAFFPPVTNPTQRFGNCVTACPTGYTGTFPDCVASSCRLTGCGIGSCNTTTGVCSCTDPNAAPDCLDCKPGYYRSEGLCKPDLCEAWRMNEAGCTNGTCRPPEVVASALSVEVVKPGDPTALTIDVFDEDSDLDASLDDIAAVTVDLTAIGGAAATPLAFASAIDAQTARYTLALDTSEATFGAHALRVTVSDVTGQVDHRHVSLVVYTGTVLDVGPDAAYPTIATAVGDAEDGDMIVLARVPLYSAFYAFREGQSDIDLTDRNIVITAGEGDGVVDLLCDCDAPSTNGGRIFFANGPTQAVVRDVNLFGCQPGMAFSGYAPGAPVAPTFVDVVFENFQYGRVSGVDHGGIELEGDAVELRIFGGSMGKSGAATANWNVVYGTGGAGLTLRGTYISNGITAMRHVLDGPVVLDDVHIRDEEATFRIDGGGSISVFSTIVEDTQHGETRPTRIWLDFQSSETARIEHSRLRGNVFMGSGSLELVATDMLVTDINYDAIEGVADGLSFIDSCFVGRIELGFNDTPTTNLVIEDSLIAGTSHSVNLASDAVTTITGSLFTSEAATDNGSWTSLGGSAGGGSFTLADTTFERHGLALYGVSGTMDRITVRHSAYKIGNDSGTGQAFRIGSSALTIRDSVFENGTMGAALDIARGSTTFERTTFRNNTLPATGSTARGTVDVYGAQNSGQTINEAVVTFDDCTFSDNSGGRAVYLSARALSDIGFCGQVTMRDTLVERQRGGGISWTGTGVASSSLLVEDSRFIGGLPHGYSGANPEGNRAIAFTSAFVGSFVVRRTRFADNDGGGLWFSNGVAGNVLVEDVELIGNSAIDGAGILLYYATGVQLTNVLFAGNEATGRGSQSVGLGGGLMMRDGGLPSRCDFCTFSGNHANFGGAAHTRGYGFSPGTLTFEHAIIWGNSAVSNGYQLIGMNDTYVVASNVEDGDPSDNYAGSTIATTDFNGGSGIDNAFWNNSFTDPLFVQGPDGDYYLSPSSICVDYDYPAALQASTTPIADRTTRTDGAPDTGRADLGYHYPAVP